jgi:hypothetical protein
MSVWSVQDDTPAETTVKAWRAHRGKIREDGICTKAAIKPTNMATAMEETGAWCVDPWWKIRTAVAEWRTGCASGRRATSNAEHRDYCADRQDERRYARSREVFDIVAKACPMKAEAVRCRAAAQVGKCDRSGR